MAFLADSASSKVGEQSRTGQRVAVRRRPALRGDGLASLRLSPLTVMLAAALGACGLWSPGVRAQSRTEYEVKSAFLYNFARFVEWPPTASEGPDDVTTICVVGEDPFGTILDETIKDKTVNGHKMVIRRLKPGQDIKVCRIAFIRYSDKTHLRNLLNSLKGASVLTVGETQDFAALGGVINFILEENRVHFEINTNAAGRAHLKVSSKLLKLAKIVRDAGPGGRN